MKSPRTRSCSIIDFETPMVFRAHRLMRAARWDACARSFVCAASQLHGPPNSAAVDTRQRDRGKIVRYQTAVTRSATVRRPHPHGCRTRTPRRSRSDDQWHAITSAAAPCFSQNSTSRRSLIRPPDDSRLPHLLEGYTDIGLD